MKAMRMKGKGKKQQPKAKTAAQLIEKAEGYYEKFQVELAAKFYQQALSIEPSNTRALDGLGEVLIELGDLENAKQAFKKSVQILPDENHAKYMNLGQLEGGEEAIKCYKKGISIISLKIHNLAQSSIPFNFLTGEPSSSQTTPLIDKSMHEVPNVESDSDSDDEHNYYDDEENESEEDEEEEEDTEEKRQKRIISTLQQEMCSGLCSIAEIYLTDECFADEAENECGVCLEQALNVCPTNAEPYFMMASYKISQRKPDEALNYLKQSFNLWRKKSPDKQPNYEVRYNTAKLFIELSHPKPAVKILELLVSEQDTISEVWYLLGLGYSLMQNPIDSLDCLETANNLLSRSDEKDEELEHQIEELLKKVKIEYDALPEEEKNKGNHIDDDNVSESDSDNDSDQESEKSETDHLNSAEDEEMEG